MAKNVNAGNMTKNYLKENVRGLKGKSIHAW